MNIKLIAIHAPPAPKCFDTRSIWIEYLVSAQQAAVGSKVRPFVDGKYRTDFPFCQDCRAAHSHAMYVAGRCDWRGYIASITPPTPETQEAAQCSST